jgi:AcrR family transcriptional regulator
MLTERLTATTEDRRITRSKRLLKQAYLALLEQRGLDGFGVGELTQRADLNRGTFYAHYKDMPDLLRSYEDEIIEALLPFTERMRRVTLGELLKAATQGTPPQVAVELFDMLREHGRFLRVLLGPAGDAAFAMRLRDLVCAQVVRAVLNKKYQESKDPLVEYYIAYYTAANLGLMQRWLERGMQESSAQMARIMLSIMFLRPGDPIELKGDK